MVGRGQRRGGRALLRRIRRQVRGRARAVLPGATVGALAGLRLQADSTRELRLGVNTLADSARVFVTGVTPGSAAADAGIEPGDQLVKVGEVEVKDENFARPVQGPLCRRRGQHRFRWWSAGTTRTHTLADAGAPGAGRDVRAGRGTPAASSKAARIRHGILTGTTGN